MTVKRVTQALVDSLIKEANRKCIKRKLDLVDVDEFLEFYQKIKQFARARNLILREVYMDGGAPPPAAKMGTTSTCVYVVPTDEGVDIRAGRQECRTARYETGDWGILRASFQKSDINDERPWWGITAFTFQDKGYTLEDQGDGFAHLVIDL